MTESAHHWTFQVRGCIDEDSPNLWVDYQFHLSSWPTDQWEGGHETTEAATTAAIEALRDAIRQKKVEDVLAADLQEALLQAPLPDGVGLVDDPDCATVLDDQSVAYFQQWKPFLDGNPAYEKVQFEGGEIPEYTAEEVEEMTAELQCLSDTYVSPESWFVPRREPVSRLYSGEGMPTPTKPIVAAPAPTPKPEPEPDQQNFGPIQGYDVKVEADAKHLIKVLKRVKVLAPELWGVFRVKA